MDSFSQMHDDWSCLNVTCNVIATERNEHENKQIKHRACSGISWHIPASRRLRADGAKPGGL